MVDQSTEDQTPPVVSAPPTPTADMLTQIQGVIHDNHRTELFLLIGTGALFTLGVVAVIVALVSGSYIWTIPSAGISAFLYWPIMTIERLRNRNIALAASAALISQLPPAQAAKEIQKLLEKLFKDDE